MSAAIAELPVQDDWCWMPPARCTPAHPEPVARTSVSVFVTVCTARRRPILANPVAVATLQRAWRDADGWAVGRYVIMPDHIHLFCGPARSRVTLKQWLGYWRSLASRRWPYPDQQPIWQPDLWDTQLRHGDNDEAKWEYVRHNPVRHRYVETAAEWPFAGEMTVLAWEDD
jgi:putative transposase